MASKRKKADVVEPDKLAQLVKAVVNEPEAPPQPRPVAPAPETTKTVDVVYMPGVEDRDDTEVAGIKFHAYEPVAVHAGRQDVIQKLHGNPWFGPKVDKDRQKAWSDYREAQAAARKAKEDADELLASKS